MDAKQQKNRFQNARAHAATEWEPQMLERFMRFGFQNGVPADKLNAFQQAVYEEFSSTSWETENEMDVQLYKAAISHLQLFSGDEEAAEELFRFSEDRDTHVAILGLPEPHRLVLTLHYLQDKGLQDVNAITGWPNLQIEERLQSGLLLLQKSLGEPDAGAAEKRLEFAAKSYKRIEFKFAENAEREEEPSPAAESVPMAAPVSKRSKVLLATAGLFLAGIIGTSYVMDNAKPDLPLTAAEAANENQITVEMLEGWKEQYNEIRESSPNRLGIDENAYNQLAYVEKADQQMERLLSNQNAEKMKDEQKKMQRQVDELMLQIETPKEMVSLFDDAFLTSVETQNFIANYALKSKELMMISEQVLLANEKELAKEIVNGELSAEKLLAGRSEYSSEVENLLDSLGERGLTIIKHPLEDRFITRRNTEALHASRLLSVDYEASNYVGLLMEEPYFDEKGLLQPVGHMPYVLTSIEGPLLEAVDSSPLYQDFELIFQQAFFLTLKGGEGQSVFDRKGIVKEEYREAWKQLAQQSRNPLIYVMMPIVEEMEASGWTSSESYDALGYDTIMKAIEMERAGKLAAELPNGEVAIDREIIQLDQHDYTTVEQLYKSFSAQHDLRLLVDVPPLDVMLLFQYANYRGDEETMWHLLSEESKPELTEYKQVWRQQSGFKDYIQWIEVSEEQITRVGASLYLYPVFGLKEEISYLTFTPGLVMDGNATWLVQNHLYEDYDLSEKESAYVKNVDALYNEFKEELDEKVLDRASPGEIGGLLLKAYEEKNSDMLSMLFEEEAQGTDNLMMQLEGRSVPLFSAALNVAFYSDPFYNNGANENGTFQFEVQSEDSDMAINQLRMVKTPSGWRFGDLNMY